MTKEIVRYRKILDQCRLFHGLDDDMLVVALEAMNARMLHYSKGETISRPGDPLREAVVVLEGIVGVDSYDADGEKTNLNMYRAGAEFGSALLLSSDNRVLMHVCACTECTLMGLDLLRLRELDITQEPLRRLLNNLILCLAEKTTDMYKKVRIYGQKRIRSRIRFFLMTMEPHDGVVTLPMNRTALAEYLGVDRTALARELGRMQEDGIIQIDKRRITLVNRDFFQPSGRV